MTEAPFDGAWLGLHLHRADLTGTQARGPAAAFARNPTSLDDFLTIPGAAIAQKAGQCFGQNFMMVHILQLRCG